MDKAKRIQSTERKHRQRKQYRNYCGKAASVTLETPKRGSSCRCCSNPRKSEKGKDKFTIQERRASSTDE